MNRAIRSVCWDLFKPDHCTDNWVPAQKVLAVWPSPVNADACFAAAGFTEFDDPDDQWDQEWRDLIGRSLAYLERYGSPRVRQAAQDYEPLPLLNRWLNSVLLRPTFKRVDMDLPLAGQIDVVTDDDRFWNVVVEFGAEPHALLRAGNGHTILFVQFTEQGETAAEEFLHQVAEGRPVNRRELDWSMLT